MIAQFSNLRIFLENHPDIEEKIKTASKIGCLSADSFGFVHGFI